MKEEKKKILAVASIGGHWIQLLRICKGLEATCSILYASTHSKCAQMVEGHFFNELIEFSRWDWYKLFPAFFNDIKIVKLVHPDVVITTGAAPGLMVLFVAFLMGKKTIWVDSIANVNHMSLCGRVARIFATRCYTQWEELGSEGVDFAGNVIG